MRLENWNPNKFDEEFENVSFGRLVEAANVIRDAAKAKCPVGTVTRPVYKSGPYAGQPWTSRDGGRLKDSVRTTPKHTKTGKTVWKKRNVRVYAGNYLAYYAAIVEAESAFLKPAYLNSLSEVKLVIGAK